MSTPPPSPRSTSSSSSSSSLSPSPSMSPSSSSSLKSSLTAMPSFRCPNTTATPTLIPTSNPTLTPMPATIPTPDPTLTTTSNPPPTPTPTSTKNLTGSTTETPIPTTTPTPTPTPIPSSNLTQCSNSTGNPTLAPSSDPTTTSSQTPAPIRTSATVLTPTPTSTPASASDSLPTSPNLPTPLPLHASPSPAVVHHIVPSHPTLSATSFLLHDAHHDDRHSHSDFILLPAANPCPASRYPHIIVSTATPSSSSSSLSSSSSPVAGALEGLGDLAVQAADWPSAHNDLRQLRAFPRVLLVVRDNMSRTRTTGSKTTTSDINNTTGEANSNDIVAGGLLVFTRPPAHFWLSTIVVASHLRNNGIGTFITQTLIDAHDSVLSTIAAPVDGPSSKETTSRCSSVEHDVISFSSVASALGATVYNNLGFNVSSTCEPHFLTWPSATYHSVAAVHSVIGQYRTRPLRGRRRLRWAKEMTTGTYELRTGKGKLACHIIRTFDIASSVARTTPLNQRERNHQTLVQAALSLFDSVVNPECATSSAPTATTMPAGNNNNNNNKSRGTRSDARLAALKQHSCTPTTRLAVVVDVDVKADDDNVVAAAWGYVHAASAEKAARGFGAAFIGPVVGMSEQSAKIAVAALLDDFYKVYRRRIDVRMLALDWWPGREATRCGLWTGLGFETGPATRYMTMMKWCVGRGSEDTAEDELGLCDARRYFCLHGYVG